MVFYYGFMRYWASRDAERSEAERRAILKVEPRSGEEYGPRSGPFRAAKRPARQGERSELPGPILFKQTIYCLSKQYIVCLNNILFAQTIYCLLKQYIVKKQYIVLFKNLKQYNILILFKKQYNILFEHYTRLVQYYAPIVIINT